MTGDGELQEGQIWESLQPVRQRAARPRSSPSSITTSCSRTRRSPRSAISGRSKTSSARSAGKCAAPTATTSRAIRDAFAHFATVTDRPKVLIADTIKGKGVSFMEGLACGDQTYHFHAGAPSLKDYLAAVGELIVADQRAARRGSASRPLDARRARRCRCASRRSQPERLVLAYGDELLQMARTRTDIVVMDADLLSDCGIEAFKEELPERFIECGIAEQHMVSAAGGMALQRHPAGGALVRLLPVDPRQRAHLQQRHRADEDHLHRDARRRRARRSRPLASVGPRHLGDRLGARADRDRAVQRARSAPGDPLGGRSRTPRAPTCASSTCRSICRTRCRRRTRCRSAAASRCATARDVALVGYGPLLMTNAWRAADELAAQGVRAAVINLPWLNRIDDAWVARDARPLSGGRHARQPLRRRSVRA